MNTCESAAINRTASSYATRILHFSLAPSFDRKFLFHPKLNEAQSGVFYFAIGQSGYRHDRAGLVGIGAEYLRALKLLIRGIGAVNHQTVAYCHTTKFALPGALLCRMFGVGQVIYFNHGVPYAGRRGVVRWALRLLERANMAAAHRFVTVSPGMVGLLRPSLIVDPWSYSTRPGSSSGLRESDYAPARLVRQRVDDTRRPGTRYLYAGRLQARKGVFVLLEAWSKHVKRFAQDELWLCGFTTDELSAQGVLPTLPGLSVKGYVTDMPDVYAQCDVVVSPSFHEGFGYSLLEGAARGCCIVSSSIPGPDVLFTHWMREQLFAPGDAIDLNRVMARLSGSSKTLAAGRLLSYRASRRFEMSKLSYPALS
jgi:glycosyltransferase involved in cell wall biosynthesis